MSIIQNNDIELHIQETIALARSLVIKSEASADVINQDIESRYGSGSVLYEYPKTWKYYLNISGQYHFTDQMMKVTSLDTHETIDFTVDNLKLHTATADAYRHGTRYYYSLLRLYPQQEVLILSILNPVNIDEAVAAPDGTILGYDPAFLEPQENTLIYDIQTYVYSFMSRYSVNGFYNIWKNYTVCQLFTLYFSLPSWIMTQRINYCKTEKAHSFHIRNYLASHGRLDKYLPYLTFEQALYLYINIDRIQKHAGKTETFEELIEWVLSKRRIPISSYTVRQLQTQNAELMPDMLARRQAIGIQDNSVEQDYVTIPVYYDKEKILKPGNARYYEANEASITHKLQTSDSSVIQTKNLESAMVDYSDAVPDPLPEVLMRQWTFMSTHDLYNVLVNFNHPVTGERYSIFASEALIYFAYVYLTSRGHTLVKLPEILNVKFRLHPRPLASLLYKDIPKEWPELYALADELVRNQPVLKTCTSVTMFFDMSYQIFLEAQKHWRIKANTGDPMKRGVVAGMINRLYGIEGIQFDQTVTMRDWLTQRSLPVFEGTISQADAILKEIFNKATGFSVDDTKSLRSIQKALIEMFSQLSSYSIQFMREINDSSIIPLNWAAIRVGVKGQDSEDTTKIPSGVYVEDSRQELYDGVEVTGLPVTVDTALHEPEETHAIKALVKVNTDEMVEFNYSVNIPASIIYDDSSASSQQQPFHPMDYYNALTQEQIQQIGIFEQSRT